MAVIGKKGKKGPLQRDLSEMVDLHLRFGLEDMQIRLDQKGWSTIINSWIIAGEDIVMRCVYKNRETNIVLRGTYHAIFTVSAADPDKNLSVYNVTSISDIRRKEIEQLEAQKEIPFSS